MSTAIMLKLSPSEIHNLFNNKYYVILDHLPKIKPPFKCYIYCSDDIQFLSRSGKSNNGDQCPFIFGAFHKSNRKALINCVNQEVNKKVIAYFTCRDIFDAEVGTLQGESARGLIVLFPKGKDKPGDPVIDYRDSDIIWKKKRGYALRVEGLKAYSSPYMELSEFEREGSYNKVRDCHKKLRGECNKGLSLKTGEYIGCEKARMKSMSGRYAYVEEK